MCSIPETARPRQTDRASVARYRLSSGQNVIAVVSPPGRKWLHVAFIDVPVRLRRVPLSDRRYMTPIHYPLADACRKMIDAGRRLGITKGAKTFLQGFAYPETIQNVTFGGSKSPPLLGQSPNADSARPIAQRGAIVTRVCPSCRNEFQARAHSKTKFCSAACKQRAYRRRVSS